MSARTALAFAFLDRYASLLIAVLSSMVIARLLSPAETGTFGVAMGLIAFISTVRDMGAGQYLLQEKELTQDRIAAVWAMQLGMGALLGLLVLVLAWPVSAFIGRIELVAIFSVVAFNFFVNPIGSLTYAWLMREMNFKALTLMRLSGTLTTALVSIGLAWQGHGAISLAWGNLAGTVAQALVASRFRPAHFPWWPRLKELPRVLSFGTRMSGVSLLLALRDWVPELFLARLQGVAAAGYFSRANGLVAMFLRLVLDATSNFAQALFAQKARAGAGLAEAFLRATAYVTVLGWSFSIVLLLLAHPVVRLLYGTQWDASVPVVRILAVAMMLMAPWSLCQAALIAVGQAGRILRLTLLSVVIAVALSGLGAYWGLLELAEAAAVAAALACLLWLRATLSVLQARARILLVQMGQSAIVAALSALPSAAAVAIWGWAPAQIVPPLALALPLTPLAFLAAVWLVRHPIRDELQRLLKR